MRTNIEIDDALMAEALRISGAGTKREVVETALRDLIRFRRQDAALDALWGIGWEGDLDEMRTDKIRPEFG
ncbi:type II toxin-antitoxin system VapB family antitoxin [uncultured Sphingomonas sp.]|uniref:type II toxin-antitoxin system VapB family antitoxin n=1 Tax=uncultured Sphingomonas sp. TaxID=158754 RepID=UPI0035CB940A